MIRSILVLVGLLLLWVFVAPRAQHQPSQHQLRASDLNETIAVFNNTDVKIDWSLVKQCAQKAYPPPPKQGDINYYILLTTYEHQFRMYNSCRTWLWVRHDVLRDAGILANDYPPEPIHREVDFK